MWTKVFAAVFLSLIVTPHAVPVESNKKELETIFRQIRLRDTFPSGGSDFETHYKCFACRLFVDSIHWIWNQNPTKDCVIELAAAVCMYLHIEDDYVCKMATSAFKDEVLYVLGKVILEPRQICGLLLDDCGGPFDPLTNNWTVPLPPAKPPVEPWRTPKPESPKLRVLHLADIHVDLRYKVGSEVDCEEPLCCRYSNGTVKNPAGKWGSVGKCDIPYRTLDSLLQHVTTEDHFDYVLWTGDLEPHNIWHYTKENHLYQLKNLTAIFKKYFPNTPIFSAVGNHEGVPMDSFAPHNLAPANYSTAWLYDTLADQWTNWISNSTREDIKWRASYIIKPYPGLRVISINTQYCDRLNFWLYINQTDPDTTLAWLVKQLTEAESAGDKVHIIGHVPSGESYCFETWSRNYYSIVNRFESTIRGQFFGHTHKDSFAVFYDQFDPKNRATNMMFVSPSVTSFGLSQGVQPSYRIYTVDGNYKGSTWSVLDTETYVMDVEEANKLDKPNWKLEYTAKTAYTMTDLFPQEWSNLIERLNGERDLLDNYIKYHYRLSDAAASKYQCDWKCRYQALCELRSGMPGEDKRFCSDLQQSVMSEARALQAETRKSVTNKLRALQRPDFVVQKKLFDKCHLL